MKRKILTTVTILLAISAFVSLFLINETKSSSVSDNISRGIILQSTARVKQTKCTNANGFKLSTTNPAVLTDHGFGSVLVFSDETSDYDNARLTVKIPKDIDSTVQPILQIDWSCPTADPTSDSVKIRWEVGYIWLANDESSDATSGVSDAQSITANYNVSTIANGLVESDVQLVDYVSTDKYLVANIARRSDATPDTGTSVAANILGACLYYTSNKLGEPL